VAAYLKGEARLAGLAHRVPLAITRWVYAAKHWGEAASPATPLGASAAAIATRPLVVRHHVATWLQPGDGPEGREVRLGARLYNPPAPAASTAGGAAAARDDTVVLFLHGGGYTIGTLGSHDATCRIMAALLRVPVLSLDYRLAPEHPFPAAPDDCLGAYLWLTSAEGCAATLPRCPGGAGGMRVIIAGDSAGGHLTLLTAMRVRDLRAGVPWHAAVLGTASGAPAVPPPAPVALLPIYPVGDMEATTVSRQLYRRGYVLTDGLTTMFNATYLGPDEARVTALVRHPAVSLLRGRDSNFAGLPPSVCLVAQCDVLHDEGVALAGRLSAAGSACTVVEAPGQIHGFVTMPRTFASGVPHLAAAVTAVGKLAGL
jgi:acetyl esterase